MTQTEQERSKRVLRIPWMKKAYPETPADL
jgi:hypothetical protein